MLQLATSYLKPKGVVRGRPPIRARRSGRLDPDVVERFRAGGPGWQGRINAAVRQASGLQALTPFCSGVTVRDHELRVACSIPSLHGADARAGGGGR